MFGYNMMSWGGGGFFMWIFYILVVAVFILGIIALLKYIGRKE